MEKYNYNKTKYVCYITNLAMASVFSLPPLLFATFKELYNISYTLLGTLVLVNFCTQLGIDLIFSFFSRYFNIHKTIRIMPLLTASGLCVYALIPMFFPKYAYFGFIVGTVLFSVAAGLAEVLISATVAALPSDTPDKDMSVLHSLYGYGFVGVVLISTVFLNFVGNQYWMYLTLFWATLPVIAAMLLMTTKLPKMNMEDDNKKTLKSKKRTKGILLCMLCIFLGACAENTMANWISVYAENSLKIPKVWGDVFGMSLFAILLALSRSGYAKFGKNISRVLMISMVSSVICYLTVSFSPNAIFSLIGCVFAGITTSMLWPGTLILMEEKIENVRVAEYALMAAGGDFGASFAPQIFGVIVDKISITTWANDFGSKLLITPEQLGFKVSMLVVALFPLLGVAVLVYMKKYFSKK